MKKIEKLEDLQSFDNACEVLGLNVKKVLPDFSCYPESDRNFLESEAKLILIIKAANKISNNGKEWVPDYTDISQSKYEPYFYMGSSGFRFYDDDYWNTYSNCGSRLCFIDYKTMMYVVNTFIDLYKVKYTR